MRLMPALETLVSACGVDNFLLGNQGGFDRAGLFALQEIKRRDPRIQYTVVLAYLPPPPELLGEPTIFPEGIETVPKRYAILFRNQWMLERADFLLVYQRYSYGGTARAVARAVKAGKRVINIAN